MSTGYDVTLFHLSMARAAVEATGARFWPLDRDEVCSRPAGSFKGGWLNKRLKSSSTVEAVYRHAQRTLREGRAALEESRIDALLIDQLDLAASSVAEYLAIPFVTICYAPPTLLDGKTPASYFGWQNNLRGRVCNYVGDTAIRLRLRPVLALINTTRTQWGLAELPRIDDTMSTTAIITQLPKELEFQTHRKRPHIYYTGQFFDEQIEPNITFPWYRLDGRPLVYASLGTIRNGDAAMFCSIAEACAAFDVQLVMSLGGGGLLPVHLGDLPGKPIVVHYAPQCKLLQRATLAINVGGLNSSLDSIRHGVPLVCIPIAEDQPGVAARLSRAGVAVIVPRRSASVSRLKAAIASVFANPSYRSAVCDLQRKLRWSGVGEATGVIREHFV